MVEMLAAVAMLSALVCGIRWPGVLIAGIPFTYQASAIAQISWLGEAYVAGAALIAIVRFAGSGAHFRPHAFDGVVFLLMTWAGITTAWAPQPAGAFEHFLQLPVSIGGIYAVTRLTVGDPNRIMTQVLFATAILGGFLAILLSRVHGGGAMRITLNEATAVGLAYPLPYALVAGVILFLLARRLHIQAIALAVLAAVGYTSVLSGTRSIFIAATASLVVVVSIILRRMPVGTATKLGLGVAVAIVAAPLFFSEAIEPALERLTMNFTGRGGVALEDQSSRERQAHYALAWELFTERPFFGYGHGSFSQLSPYLYPHNLFLEAGSEMGVGGVIIVLAWLGLIARGLVDMLRRHPTAGLVMIALGIIAFIQAQLSFTLYMLRYFYILSALIAVWHVKQRRSLRAATRRRPNYTHTQPTAPQSARRYRSGRPYSG